MKISNRMLITFGIIYIVASIIIVALINYNMRKQAFIEAESKALMLLNHNLAIHNYFQQELKPKLFSWSEPFRPPDYFEPTWMSSTYAIRQMDHYFKSLEKSKFYYKECAINARSPENEADPHEKIFLEQLTIDPKLVESSEVRTLNGQPFFVIMRRGLEMEKSCLRCHSTPDRAPGNLVKIYGPTRSFGRLEGEVVHVISIRIPLAEAYGQANRLSWNLSGILLALLGCLFASQTWISKRWLFDPMAALRQKALEIAESDARLGETIPVPPSPELRDLTTAFNAMSRNLRQSHDSLEERVRQRTADLNHLNKTLKLEIAERQRAEATLHESERFLASIFDCIQDGITLVGTDFDILRVNPTVERWSEHGMPLLGKKCYAAFHGRQEPCELCPVRRTLDTGETACQVVPKQDSRGEIVGWVELSTYPLTDSATGKIKGVIEYVRDITIRKKAQEALHTTQERLQFLITAIPAVIYTARAGGDFGATFVSDSITDRLGYEPRDFLDDPSFWRNHLHPEDAPRVLADLPVVFKQGCHIHEYRFLHKDGSYRWMHDELRLVRDGQGQPLEIIGYWTDITEHKKLEEQLRQAIKMEAVGRLAGGVAHDFNNILTAIIGYAELLLMNPGDQEPRRQEVQEIQRAADRAASLTRQLLAFSRKQVLQPRLLHLNALVADMDKMLRRIIGEDMELVTILGQKLGLVKADPGQIEQIIMNLAVNARDAMPQGGKLTIETANADLDEEYARQHLEVTPGPYVMLSVSDTGVGLDAEARTRIFEPFFTTKEQGQGTGLGLSTVYGIVKQSGGHIWVYSEPGRGTTFKVYLPRLAQPGKVACLPPVPVSSLEGSETILLVEDEELVRQVARRMLERHGYTVLEAGTGREALALSAQRQGPIHLMLTDVVMPGMSGQELAKQLSRQRPEIKVLYMSGHTENAIVHHGMLDPGIAFLQKPFRHELLVRQVRQVLDAPL